MPPSGYTQLIEVYRGVEIWWSPDDLRYWCTVYPYTATSDSLSWIKIWIDEKLGAGPTLKPTALTLSVSPTTGTPPYGVTITAVLTSGGVGVGGKIVLLYKDGVQTQTGTTDSTGKAVFTDTVTAKASYYTMFMGDSEYSGCDTEGAGQGGLGGLGLLILLALMLMEAK